MTFLKARRYKDSARVNLLSLYVCLWRQMTVPRSTGEKPATVLTEIVAPAQRVHPDAELDMKTKDMSKIMSNN